MRNETFAQGLRALANIVEHSTEELDLVGITVNSWCATPEQMVQRAKGIGGRFDKVVLDNYYVLRQPVGEHTLDVFMPRTAVCTKVVVGQEEVEVPDPDAPRITITRDITEWDCTPSVLALASAIPEVVQ